MICIFPLAFTVYLIFSKTFDSVRCASFTSNEENDKTSYLTTRMKSLKVEGNGPFIDTFETFEEFQETGPFRVNRMKTSLSCECLNSASSGKYSPLARLAFSNSSQSVLVQGDEVNKLISGAENSDEDEEDVNEVSEEHIESNNKKDYDNLKLKAEAPTKKKKNC